MASGEARLWSILNDKLDTLRANGQLAEAVRVGLAALDLAKRAFPAGDPALALSLEKIGQLHDQAGDQVAAKPYLVRAQDRKSTRLNSSHCTPSRMPSSA